MCIVGKKHTHQMQMAKVSLLCAVLKPADRDDIACLEDADATDQQNFADFR